MDKKQTKRIYQDEMGKSGDEAEATRRHNDFHQRTAPQKVAARTARLAADATAAIKTARGRY